VGIRAIAQRGANAPDRVIQTLVEIDESIRPPDLPDQFLPRNDIAGIANQHREDSSRLRLEVERMAMSLEFPCSAVKLKFRK